MLTISTLIIYQEQYLNQIVFTAALWYRTVSKYHSFITIDNQQMNPLWQGISYRTSFVFLPFILMLKLKYSSSHLFLQMFWRSLMTLTNGIAGNPTQLRGASSSYRFRGYWSAVKSSEMKRSRLLVRWWVSSILQLLRQRIVLFLF